MDGGKQPIFKALALCLSAAGALLAQVGYEGPSILSRGGVPNASSNQMRGDIDFRPYVGLTGTYSHGLLAPRLDKNGNLIQQSSEGVQGMAGIYGSHTWKRSLLSIDYRLSFQHYFDTSSYDSVNQWLTAGYSRQLSRRWTMSLAETAGYVTEATGIVGSAPMDFAGNSTLGATPAVNLFDTPTFFANSQANFTYQASPRLSFNMGGSEIQYKPRTSALYGTAGETASGDIAYRTSMRNTIGVAYQFGTFGYTKAFGDYDMHSLSLFFSRRLTRTWQFHVNVGAYRVESEFLTQVAVDPIIAQLLGTSVGIQLQHSLHYSTVVSAGVQHSFKNNSSFTAGYNRGVEPGNGVYLTSQQETFLVAYSFMTVHHWNVGLNGNHTKMKSLVQNIAPYSSYAGGIGVTRSINAGTYVVANVSYQRYLTQLRDVSRGGLTATLGFVFSPGNVPLRLF